MKAPFFSIIIPTLNEEKYVPILLANLCKQTCKDFEVFVVDGLSVDKTIQKVKVFKTKLPLKIISSMQKNVGAQRNRGAKEARGIYVVFFDADVGLPPDFLALLKEDLITSQSVFATTRLAPDSKKTSDRALVQLANLSMHMSLFVEKPFVGGYNFIVKRSVFLSIGGFREDNFHGEDYELSLRLFNAGHALSIFKRPAIIYSLRRFRREGKLTVLGKNAKAAIHLFTKGPITSEIFDYPMGGSWYALKKKEQVKPQVMHMVETHVKKFLRVFLVN